MQKPLLGLLLLPGLAAAQANQSYTIKGQVSPSVNAPAKAYLYFGTAYVDSAAVRDGRFTLKGHVANPGKAFVLLSRRGSRHDTDGMGFARADVRAGFYLEPGTTTLVSADSLKHARLTGGPLTTEWAALTQAEAPVSAGFRQYYADGDAATSEQRAAATYKPARAQRRAALIRQRMAIDSVFIVAHPASVVSLDQVGLISNTKADSTTARHLLASLAPALQASPEGQKIQSKLLAYRHPPLAVGMPAPNFTLLTADGQPVALSSYRGRYVLVDFWASWCAPCRAENPNVVRAYEAFKAKRFEVLSVSIDAPDNRAQWLQAVHTDQLPWAQVLDQPGPNAVAKLYQVQAIPQNFLLDPQGRIVAINLRGEALPAKLTQLIK